MKKEVFFIWQRINELIHQANASYLLFDSDCGIKDKG